MNASSKASPEIHLVIKKSERTLVVYSDGEAVKKIGISLGFEPGGDKNIEGDGRTPEGEFYVFTKNDKSSFFLSLGLSYPNAEDADRGLSEGLISEAEHSEILKAIANRAMPPQTTALGGEIYIHGGGCDGDWTKGCIALDNDKMQELFDIAAKGTRVSILP
ncbi:MAG: L,D-transpeptidase family protein [Acidobacteria bacterium]|nr:L,D-transpeptidase family protein [Acidobacteriota bacterium]